MFDNFSWGGLFKDPQSTATGIIGIAASVAALGFPPIAALGVAGQVATIAVPALASLAKLFYNGGNAQ